MARSFACCVHVLAVLHQRYCLQVSFSLFFLPLRINICSAASFLCGKGQQLTPVVSLSFCFSSSKKPNMLLWILKFWNCTIIPHPLPCPVTARRLSLCVPPPLACTVAPPAAEEYWRACSCDTTHIQRCKSSAHAHCVATSKCWSFACSVITLFYAHMTINYCLIEVILIVIMTYQWLLIVIATFDCRCGDYFSLPLFVFATLVLNLFKKSCFFETRQEKCLMVLCCVKMNRCLCVDPLMNQCVFWTIHVCIRHFLILWIYCSIEM